MPQHGRFALITQRSLVQIQPPRALRAAWRAREQAHGEASVLIRGQIDQPRVEMHDRLMGVCVIGRQNETAPGHLAQVGTGGPVKPFTNQSLV
jgi:hypothetical protein